MKSLEDDVGAPLFERHSRGVSLSDAGASALDALTDAFDKMGVAVQGLRRAAAPSSVHIATLPAIAQLWLSPRLPALRASLPGLDVSVSAIEAPPDLKRVPFDICIFVTEMPPKGATLLAHDCMAPVCSPELSERLSKPEDLSVETFLIDAAWNQDWAIWFERMDVGTPSRIKGPVFSLYALAVDEALHGAGVLMGHLPLIRGHMDAGKLVLPFPQLILPHGQIAAWSLPASRSNAAVAWVLDELKKLS